MTGFGRLEAQRSRGLHEGKMTFDYRKVRMSGVLDGVNVPENVSKSVGVFLCSNDCAFLRGQNLMVDSVRAISCLMDRDYIFTMIGHVERSSFQFSFSKL